MFTTALKLGLGAQAVSSEVVENLAAAHEQSTGETLANPLIAVAAQAIQCIMQVVDG